MEQIQHLIYTRVFELVEADGYEFDEATTECVSYLTESLNMDRGHAEFIAASCADAVREEMILPQQKKDG